MSHNLYVTDLSVLCHAEKIKFTEGKAEGMNFIHMYNGSLNLMISVDRALDIYSADFRGKNVVFKSKNGIVNPKLSSQAIGFINDFGGGLLYTCGLDNIGGPRDGYIQHGSLAYLPAEHVNITKGFDEHKKFFVSVEGEIKYTSLFGHHLVLKRSIKLFFNQSSIFIEDQIENLNHEDDQYMLMYHFNFGYPFINEHTKLYFSNISKTDVFNQNKKRTYSDFHRLEKPIVNYPEEVFIHEFDNTSTKIDIINQEDSVSLHFDNERLKYMTQWKSMASGDYALGIEPATTKLSERAYTPIKAFDNHVYKLELTFKNKENTHE